MQILPSENWSEISQGKVQCLFQASFGQILNLEAIPTRFPLISFPFWEKKNPIVVQNLWISTWQYVQWDKEKLCFPGRSLSILMVFQVLGNYERRRALTHNVVHIPENIIMCWKFQGILCFRPRFRRKERGYMLHALATKIASCG